MNNPNESLLTFVVGAVAGAAVALLVAPRSGVETRDALRRGAGEAAHNVADRARDYTHRVGDVVGGAREAVRRPGEAVKGAAQAAKAAFQQQEMKNEGA